MTDEPLSRQLLRSRTVELLIAAGVSGGNIAASRVRPLRDGGPSQTLVYTTREGGTSSGPNGPPSFQTTVDLVIDSVAVTPDEDDAKDDEEELDDLLDALADSILEATLMNPSWLLGVEEVQQFEVVKHPAGADGKPIIGGVRVSMQVSIGLVIYEPNLTTALQTIGARPIVDGDTTRQFGVDVNGDGEADIEFEEELPQ